MKVMYIACDGKQFTSKKACEGYEQSLIIAKEEHDKAREAIDTLRNYCSKLYQRSCHDCVFKSNCYYGEDASCAPMDWE